jgi:hypothetical protein
VPVFLVIFCSGWRTTTMLDKMREKKGIEKRKAVLQQFGCLLVDLPFVLMGSKPAIPLQPHDLLGQSDPHLSHPYRSRRGAAQSSPC